jgi:hypothetical protein
MRDGPCYTRATPRASCRRCGSSSPSTRHLHDRRHRRNRRGHPPGSDQLPARPGRATGTIAAFFPDQADLALATFLLKVLLPGFFTRGRPGRAGPRSTKKADDFPARQPGEPQRHQSYP